MKQTLRHAFAAISLSIAASAASAATTVVNVPGNGSLALSTSTNNKDGTMIVAAAGSTLTLPKSTSTDAVIYSQIVVSGGVVRVTCESGSSYTRYRFVSGLRAVDGGSLVVDQVPLISVDRQSWGSAATTIPTLGPICDIADVSFENTTKVHSSGLSGLMLRLNSTVRQLPETCPVWVEKNATVALAGTDPSSAAALLSSGTLCVTNFDIIATTAQCLPAGCRVEVSPGSKFIFRKGNLSDDSTAWTPAPGSTGRFNIVLGGRGSKLWIANDGTDMHCRCESNVSGLGEIIVRPVSGTSKTRFRGLTYQCSPTAQVSIPVDSKRDPAPSASWQGKVAHWFDFSDADSAVPFTFDANASFGWTGAENTFNGHPIVIGWKDKVAASGISLYNRRIWGTGATMANPTASGYLLRVMPYLVEGGLNGLSYLCCGTYGETVANAQYNSSGKLASGAESRRLRFWSSADIGDAGSTWPKSGAYTSFESPYCILVFGSQQGGGVGVIGTTKDDSKYGQFVRKKGLGETWTTRDNYAMHVDGITVNPKSDMPNGGWQILAIDMTGTNTAPCSLGSQYDDSSCGGQNYAEVIFFSEKPTVAERAACELYLARKWGLEDTYVQWDNATAALGGSAGTVILLDDAHADYDHVEEVAAAGTYSGTVNIPDGSTLVIDKPLPPTEADVPSEGRIGWYDPDFAGAATCDSDLGAADLLNILYGRDESGILSGDNDRMFSGGWRTSGAKTANFAPRVVNDVRGWLTTGPARNWLVFKETRSDSLGNMIRSRLVSTGVNGSMNARAARQGFFVTDTTDGGGDLFSNNAEFLNGGIKPRNGTDFEDPIWTPSNTVTMASTWLNTEEIDGTARGYNGQPEVLTFASESDFSLAYIGNYKGANTEVVGEFILYSLPLPDAERTAVQEYLMNKWFGDLNGKYADWSDATVTGAGRVSSATLRNLPQFSNSFTGTVTGGTDMAFYVDSSLDDSAATDAIAFDAPLALDDGATVTVSVGSRLSPGLYTLLTATSVSGSATLVIDGEIPGGRTAALRCVGNTLSLEVLANPFMMIVR